MKRRPGCLLPGLLAAATVAAGLLLWLTGPAREPDPAIVFAPSSLAPLQPDLDDALRARGLTPPTWVFAGSQTLVAQLRDGAPADVVITADDTSFEQAGAAVALAHEGIWLASNPLVLAVAPGNPGAVEGIGDLEDADRLIGICADAVPCGRLTTRALSALGISVTADTEESSVRALTTKIRAGELDTGLVYRSDARTADLAVIPVAGLDTYQNRYWASRTADSDASGSEVIDLLVSAAGQDILASAGLTPRDAAP